jgi:hypothetical protein
MDCAVSIAREAHAQILPESAREDFRNWFEQNSNERQREYGKLNVRKTPLALGFGRRVCYEAGAYNPVVLLGLTEWASGIPPMMLKIAETL